MENDPNLIGNVQETLDNILHIHFNSVLPICMLLVISQIIQTVLVRACIPEKKDGIRRIIITVQFMMNMYFI